MAIDGVLGKKLSISILDEDGASIGSSPEFLKWSVEEITEEHKKNPLGDEGEHRVIVQKGFKGTLEGENVNTAVDEIIDRKIEAQARSGRTLKFNIFTTMTYANSDVIKYKYSGVTFDGYSQSVDDGAKTVVYKLTWHAKSRELQK